MVSWNVNPQIFEGAHILNGLSIKDNIKEVFWLVCADCHHLGLAHIDLQPAFSTKIVEYFQQFVHDIRVIW